VKPEVFYPSCDSATAEAVPWNYLYSRSYGSFNSYCTKLTANKNARIAIIPRFVNYDYWLFWGNRYGPKEGITSMVVITLESKTLGFNPIKPETMKELNDNGPSFHIWPVIFVHVSYHHQSCILITALLTKW
jgi:hypothetical protein